LRRFWTNEELQIADFGRQSKIESRKSKIPIGQ
jgi:hypothetical protein